MENNDNVEKDENVEVVNEEVNESNNDPKEDVTEEVVETQTLTKQEITDMLKEAENRFKNLASMIEDRIIERLGVIEKEPENIEETNTERNFN